MAIARLQIKVGKIGKAAIHAAYISRSGKYENRLSNGERLLFSTSGNMPPWAKAEPLLFWQAADAHERANGTTYREMEIALPRELNERQLIALTKRWVKEEIGNKHAYQWAIHIPKAADGGDQPHVHLMFSERQADDIERSPEQYFKRYNSKAPEKGGARKGYGAHAGQTLSKAERIEDLKALRLRWQRTCNDYLRWEASSPSRIDMRSYAEQGLAVTAEPKQLPGEWRGEGKKRILELRAARAEVKAQIPYFDEGARRIHGEKERIAQRERQLAQKNDLAQREQLEKHKIFYAISLEKLLEGRFTVAGSHNREIEQRLQQQRQRREAEERAARAKAEALAQKAQEEAQTKAQAEQARKAREAAEAAAAAEREQERQEKAERQAHGISEADYARYQTMDSHALSQAIQRLRPPDLEQSIAQDSAVQAVRAEQTKLAALIEEAQQTAQQAQQEATRWRQAHRLRAWLHDRGTQRASYLEQRQKTATEAKHLMQRLTQGHEDATGERDEREARTRERITQEQAPIRLKLDWLERLQREKARQETERQREEAKRQAQEHAQRRETQAALDKFKRFASERDGDRMGYTRERWALLPDNVRSLVEEYNGHPYKSPGRECVLKRLTEQHELRRAVETALDAAESQRRSRGRG